MIFLANYCFVRFIFKGASIVIINRLFFIVITINIYGLMDAITLSRSFFMVI